MENLVKKYIAQRDEYKDKYNKYIETMDKNNKAAFKSKNTYDEFNICINCSYNRIFDYIMR